MDNYNLELSRNLSDNKSSASNSNDLFPIHAAKSHTSRSRSIDQPSIDIPASPAIVSPRHDEIHDINTYESVSNRQFNGNYSPQIMPSLSRSTSYRNQPPTEPHTHTRTSTLTLDHQTHQNTDTIQRLSSVLNKAGLPPLHPALLYAQFSQRDTLSNRQVEALDSLLTTFAAEYTRRGGMIQDLISRVSGAEERLYKNSRDNQCQSRSLLDQVDKIHGHAIGFGEGVGIEVEDELSRARQEIKDLRTRIQLQQTRYTTLESKFENHVNKDVKKVNGMKSSESSDGYPFHDPQIKSETMAEMISIYEQKLKVLSDELVSEKYFNFFLIFQINPTKCKSPFLWMILNQNLNF